MRHSPVAFLAHMSPALGSILCDLHVSMDCPSMGWCSKPSIHLFLCWRGIVETAFSALLVTDILLLTLCTLFFLLYRNSRHKTKEIFYPGPTSFSDGAWLLKGQGQRFFCTQWVLCPLRKHPTFVHTGIAHLCAWLWSWCLSPKGSSAILVVVWNPERWTVCEIRHFLCFLEP